MLEDTGSVYMCIKKSIQAQLQIPVIEKRKGPNWQMGVLLNMMLLVQQK